MMNTAAAIAKKIHQIDGLTDEDLQNSKRAFGLYDKQGCGYITSKQIGMLMRTLGQNPTEDELVEILNEYDVDGNGIIDFPEFVCLMQIRLKSYSDEDMLREAFRVFDSDGSGSISLDEFKSVMEDIPDVEQDASLIEEMIAEIDKDGDGQIDYEEFLKLVSTAGPEKEAK